MTLATRIAELFDGARPAEEAAAAFEELKAGLNEGLIRAAEPDPGSPTGWKANAWVKKGLLLGFRMGRTVEMSACSGGAAAAAAPLEGTATFGFQFRDKHTYPLQKIPPERNVRVVPGGSSIRDACYIGRGVICMPPMFVNAGAYVDDETLIDSHALVGSCAQIGKRCHLSAGAQIGGVLEPVGALPVIVEDEVLVGGNCGVYEGTIVGRGAVLAAGTILTGSTPVFDLVRDAVYRREGSGDRAIPLRIPAGAVVVPGARAVTKGRGRDLGLSLYAAVIVKYRDDKTDVAARLEELLR
ncbi:MAG TPA: 2,3,4,5-tetrahydropyridine-2,6-dicarboxylate N-succinyltransferase [Terriglobia bacterium]|nr:2,3,4,5-tetrahydropyridine-2,6-dicarboxylate N-succinyltransferase [Terriglobia bacterium]